LLVRMTVGSLLLLVLATIAVLLIRQPARRIRVIQGTLIGLVALPLLMLVPGYPRWQILPALDATAAAPLPEEPADPQPPIDEASVERAPIVSSVPVEP